MAKSSPRKRAKPTIRKPLALNRKRILDLILQAAVDGDDELLESALLNEVVLYSKGVEPNLFGLLTGLRLVLLNLIFDPRFEIDILFDGRPVKLDAQRTASSVVTNAEANLYHLTFRDGQPRETFCFAYIMNDDVLVDFRGVHVPAVSKGDTLCFEYGTEFSFRRVFDNDEIDSNVLVGQIRSKTLYLRVEEIIYTLGPGDETEPTQIFLAPIKENTIINIFTDGSLVQMELAEVVKDNIDPFHIRNRLN